MSWAELGFWVAMGLTVLLEASVLSVMDWVRGQIERQGCLLFFTQCSVFSLCVYSGI